MLQIPYFKSRTTELYIEEEKNDWKMWNAKNYMSSEGGTITL